MRFTNLFCKKRDFRVRFLLFLYLDVCVAKHFSDIFFLKLKLPPTLTPQVNFLNYFLICIFTYIYTFFLIAQFGFRLWFLMALPPQNTLIQMLPLLMLQVRCQHC